ncbi:glutaredoxin family protein [Leptolyngbya iicbica LK]|uniref:Glutaredoxin family protein n=2 Tax=Cyanophyceae TaxID=3028117 RepID=A0A4V2E2V7_9CYAN|nr:glutaredoxin family protein [Leptolyngbya sp. LK]
MTPAASWAEASDGVVDVYFFHSESCPHCREQMPLMQDIDAYNDDVDVHIIEVNEEPEEFREYLQAHNIQTWAVPRTAIGELSFIGYNATSGPKEYVEAYSGYIGYRNQIVIAISDAVGHDINLSQAVATADAHNRLWWIAALPVLYLASGIPLRDRLQQPQSRRYWIGGLAAVLLLCLFALIGFTPESTIRSFAQGLPFPLFVGTIALADGFNPCAFTVLVILLSLLTYTHRRRDMVLIGGTFVLTSAVMYFLFIMLMIGLGSVLIEQYGNVILLLLGIAITIAGLINIKDYFWFKEGVSLSLSADQQRTISKKAGKIVRDLRSADKNRWQFAGALGGTVLLAVFVNIVELGCTAILPVVYMTTLINYCAVNGGAAIVCYSAWTGLYAAIYVLPLLLILAGFIYAFQSARLTESQGRILKLGGGLFMLFFGLVMIFKPQLLMFG